MPRDEATAISEALQKKELVLFGKDVFVENCRSFRRGKTVVM
jgi:hypothetical protein